MTNRTDTEGGAMTLEKGLAAFLDAMLGKNRSSATLRAYRTDVLQFIAFLKENNVAITQVGDVGKVDVLEYLAALAKKGLTGVARARKVSAIREYFRYLEGVGVVQKSPTAGIDTPKRCPWALMTQGAFWRAACSHRMPNIMRKSPTGSPGNR